jgi:hypothetical protein
LEEADENSYCGAEIEKKCTLYFLFTYFYFVEKKGGRGQFIKYILDLLLTPSDS